MRKLLACIVKELTLLVRDFSGLMVLFVMPAALVIVVTLIQENILKSTGETKTRILFIDIDQSTAGRQLEEAMRNSGSVEIIKTINGKAVESNQAKEAVARGDFQAGIIIPRGLTEAFKKIVRQRVEDSFSVGDIKREKSTREQAPNPELDVFFDPTLRENFRSAVINALEKGLLGMEIKERMTVFFELLPRDLELAAKEAAGPMWSEEFKKRLPKLHVHWDDRPLLTIKEKAAQIGQNVILPNTIQQNVPAWTLFGVFFIVVPLGGSIIRERQDGLLARLLTMPTSFLIFLSGKITAYVMICLVQFGLIMALGKLLLPLLGAPVLNLGTSPAALLLIVLSAALAAAGYGILLGTIARTFEQASMFGAVSVVIAAALGGIMIPVYVMPRIMQKISEFSPLAWGHKAFLNIFVRNGDVQSVFPQVAQLMLFFVVTTVLAWFLMSQRGRIRIK